MTEDKIRLILEKLKNGDVGLEEAYENLKFLPFEDINIAMLDHHREIRTTHPEVVFGKNKTVSELKLISKAILDKGSNLLITKINSEKAKEILPLHKSLRYNERGEVLVGELNPVEKKGLVAVVSAGTSDLNTVEESIETLNILGNNYIKIVDVGVAGIHRLFSKLEEIRKANVIIVIAGMEGALASVLGGLVETTVIAVPTSVGYGASMNGVAALLSMLNSCSPNVSVVNIDNGFSAAYSASIINRKL